MTQDARRMAVEAVLERLSATRGSNPGRPLYLDTWTTAVLEALDAVSTEPRDRPSLIRSDSGDMAVDATAVVAVQLMPPLLMQRHHWWVIAYTSHGLQLVLENVETPEGTMGGEPETRARMLHDRVVAQFKESR